MMYTNDFKFNRSLLNDTELIKSVFFMTNAIKVNIFSIMLLTVVNLIVNLITAFVFSQKRFRTNSNNVCMLALAINHTLFLIVNFFQSTLRKYSQVFHTDLSRISILIKSSNFIDRFGYACRILNYLKNVFCLISVFIIISILKFYY